MERNRKEKLIKYLFYDNSAVEFMFNDFYVELCRVLPKNICFSKENIKKENRVNNLAKAKNTVKEFLKNNVVYYEKLKEIYGNKNIDCIINDVLAGYVLYLTPHVNKNSGADVYADKRSICYSRFSILDTYLL
ncbi:MAG: hypothetical protein IJW26_05845 [Clostridia bacterium]|nr:hypothetical protein [Clostridia bacterium]